MDCLDTGVFRHISSVPDDEINLEAYPPPRFICQYANGNVWARKKLLKNTEVRSKISIESQKGLFVLRS